MEKFAQCLCGMACGLLLLPGVAAGQAPPRSQPGYPPRPIAGAGMSLQDFTARRAQRILSADTDGDGKVSRTEFLAAQSGKGDPSRQFARLDRDGDGMIDRSEIAAMATRRFVRLDANGDGILTPAERLRTKATSDGEQAGELIR